MLPLHKLCELLPDIKGKQFDEMVDDILDRGQVDPIDVYEGEVIDGKNRQRACEAAGVSPQYVEWVPPEGCETDEDVQNAIGEFIYSRNFLRRHQSETDRAMYAAVLRKHTGMSYEKVAQDMNVSERSISHANVVIEKGDESLVDAVRNCGVSVSDAASVCDLPKEEQAKAVSKYKSGKARTVSAAARPKKDIPAPVFDTEESIQEMSGVLRIEDIFGEQESSFLSDELRDELKEEYQSENVAVNGGVDGSIFTASAQASWRSSFSLMVRMAGEWIKNPLQQATKMKSERSFGEYQQILNSLEAKWREMNKGQGRWS